MKGRGGTDGGERAVEAVLPSNVPKEVRSGGRGPDSEKIEASKQPLIPLSLRES